MQWMSTASADNFQQEVIERSAQQLVLVDFWAPWCNPCRVLGPLLEAVVESRGGKVFLVKVNADRERELAQSFRVQGIPAVKAFVEGRPVDEFVGLRDRRFLEAFVDRLLPSPETQALHQGGRLLAEGQASQVEAALGPALQSPQHREEALLLLARSQAASGAAGQALQTLAEIGPGSLLAEPAAYLGARLELLAAADGADPEARRRQLEASPEQAELRWSLAAELLSRGEVEPALEALLELLQRDRAFRNDGARRAMLGIFAELGPDHDLSREFRRRLQIYL